MEEIIPTIDGGIAAPIAAADFYEGQSFREELQQADMQLQHLQQTDMQLQNHDMGLLDRYKSQTRMEVGLLQPQQQIHVENPDKEIQEQGSLLSQPFPTDIQNILDDFCPSFLDIPSPIESWEQLEQAHMQVSGDNFPVELAPISDGPEMSMGRMPQRSFGDSQRTNEATPNMLVKPEQLSPRPIALFDRTPLQLSHTANGTSQLLSQGSCLQGGSVLPSIENPLKRLQTFNIMHLARPFHLPAPPEADPQVMLAKRPKNGKNLEAVISISKMLHDYFSKA